jgi:hypothetical protein
LPAGTSGSSSSTASSGSASSSSSSATSRKISGSLLVAHVDDRLEVMVRVVVLGPEADRVGVRRVSAADPEERQGRRLADPVDRAADRERFCALRLGVSRAAHVVDVGDDGDPVSLGDALAESTRTGHVPCLR